MPRLRWPDWLARSRLPPVRQRALAAFLPPVMTWLGLFTLFAWLLVDTLLALGEGTPLATYVWIMGGFSTLLVVGMTALLVFAFGVSLVLSVEWLDDGLDAAIALVAIGRGFWAFAAQAALCVGLLLVMPPPALSMNYEDWWQLDEELASLEAVEWAGMFQYGAMAAFLALVVWQLRPTLGAVRSVVAVATAASAVAFVLGLFNWVAPEAVV